MPFPRAGLLVAWGTAFLQGRSPLDDASLHIPADDAFHRVVGLPGEPDAQPWATALGALRAAGAESLRLVLPEPGDALGLPGPAALNEAATAAGETAVVVGGPPLALVPTAAETADGAVVRWDVLPADPSVGSAGLPSVAEAERELAERMREGIAALESLDLARGRERIGDRMAAVARRSRTLMLPPSLPARAVRLLEQATGLAAIVELAREDDGAAVTLLEAQRRDEALRPLSSVARHALCAAYSAGSEPAPAPR